MVRADYSHLSHVINFWATFMLLNAALTSNSIEVTTFVVTAKLHFYQQLNNNINTLFLHMFTSIMRELVAQEGKSKVCNKRLLY